jgi:hypothetical protein
MHPQLLYVVSGRSPDTTTPFGVYTRWTIFCSVVRAIKQWKSVSIDGKSFDRTVSSQVWNLRETPFTNLATLHGHEQAVLSLTVKERTVFSGGADKSIFVGRHMSIRACLINSTRCRCGISIVTNVRHHSTHIPVVAAWNQAWSNDMIRARSSLFVDACRSAFVQFIKQMSESMGHISISIGSWNSNWRTARMVACTDEKGSIYLCWMSTCDQSRKHEATRLLNATPLV